MNADTVSAMTSAASETPSQICPNSAKPVVMAMAAPKLAPAVTPKVYGLARGLFVIV